MILLQSTSPFGPLTIHSFGLNCTFNPFSNNMLTESKFSCNLGTWRVSLISYVSNVAFWKAMWFDASEFIIKLTHLPWMCFMVCYKCIFIFFFSVVSILLIIVVCLVRKTHNMAWFATIITHLYINMDCPFCLAASLSWRSFFFIVDISYIKCVITYSIINSFIGIVFK